MNAENFIIQAENSIAGCILIEPVYVLEAIRGIVSEGDFLSPQPRAVFLAASSLVDQGKPCDPNLIMAEAGAAVSVEYCAEAMNITPTTVNAAEYARIVHEAAQSRRAREIGLKLAEGEKTPIDTLASLQELLKKESGTVHTPMEAAQSVMDYISDAATGKTKPFLSTGYKPLDAILSGGLASGGLIVLAARPGTGKTTSALAIAERVAARNHSVLYISLEMTEAQLWSCRAANETGLSRSDIYSGRILDGRPEGKKIVDAFDVLCRRPLMVRDVPSTMDDIEREARCIKGLSLLVVDHIGLVKPTMKGSRYEIMTDTSHRLKQLALSLQIPILALCQLNRQSEQRESKRPTMADLRDSGAIEEDSDVVCILFREAAYLPEDKKPKPWEQQRIDFIIDKNRHGRTGIVHLGFCPYNTRIFE